jgi:glutathione S-transferase
MNSLSLYVDDTFISPWAMSAFVACEEKRVPYTLVTLSLAKKETFAPTYLARTRRLPALRRGDYWLSESAAICEYLAENYPFPAHPRLYPENLDQRGVCRELQHWLRTDLQALRQERPTTSVWGPRVATPLSAEAQAAAARLVNAVTPLLAHGGPTLFDQWCIADAELALALQRLNLNGDALPATLKDYAEGLWRRPSLAKWNALPR